MYHPRRRPAPLAATLLFLAISAAFFYWVVLPWISHEFDKRAVPTTSQ